MQYEAHVKVWVNAESMEEAYQAFWRWAKISKGGVHLIRVTSLAEVPDNTRYELDPTIPREKLDL